MTDLSTMSRSYPFWWIAKNYGVDYGHVLKVANGYDAGYLRPPANNNYYDEYNEIFFTIFAACHAPWRWRLLPKDGEIVIKRGLWEYSYDLECVNELRDSGQIPPRPSLDG
jgi:hypothetical protein